MIAHFIKASTLRELVMARSAAHRRHAELGSASIPRATASGEAVWTLKQVQGDVEGVFA